MSSIRAIKRRITSVTSTSQITKAMQMVSASKMKKAQDLAQAGIPYATGIYNLISGIGPVKDYNHKFLNQPNSIKTVGIVLVAPSRGFAGSLPSSLLLKSSQLIDSIQEKYPKATIKGIGINKVAIKTLLKLNIDVDYQFTEKLKAPTQTELQPIFNTVESQFTDEKYDEIHLVYSHFINTMTYKASTKKLLPLSLSDMSNKDTKIKEHTFEPSAKKILDYLLPEYFQTQIHSAILESLACEHSARMVAMKQATDNAKSMIKDLNLLYNKTRQTTITREMLEIVTGAESF